MTFSRVDTETDTRRIFVMFPIEKQMDKMTYYHVIICPCNKNNLGVRWASGMIIETSVLVGHES